MFDLQTKVTMALASLVLMGLTAGVGYYYGDKARGIEADLAAANLQLAHDAAILAAGLENDAAKVKLQEKKNENDILIRKLAHAKSAGGLQLPTCPKVDPVVPATGSEPATPDTGALPNEAQRAFDRFTEGLDKLALEADQLTEQCRVVVDWAKGVK